MCKSLSSSNLFFFFLRACFIECLKDVRVSVPQAIKRGETAVFMCDFDLEGDLLYTVKWYKGRSEFFRYTPKDEFPIKIFPLDGLTIDL
ncbi:beat protein, putative [Pediculus humanus corporis]|uniref:Beat protein, putative n=1 Tax=Pediculus humanus subsp. corporis TaxID=121224 RepID=E0VL24_PEDHC|nr:beat protein, putative [Pediculus humanus corporis]EEB14080.1 beat protein, putative [Pediculus humanus corporis]